MINMKKIIVLLLSVLFLFSTLAGCKEEPENPSTGGGDQTTTETTDPRLVNPVQIMNDFESILDMQMWKPARMDSGKWELQKDYVKSGENGAKLTTYCKAVDGDASTDPVWTSQCRVFETGEDWSRKMKDAFLITLDVYNPEDVSRQVGIKLNYGNSTSSVMKWVDCAPNAWTTVEYDIQKEYMPYTVVSVRDDIKEVIVNSISMSFRRIKGVDYTLYFDALKIYYNSVEVETVEKTLEADSFLSFDKSWMINESTVNGGNAQYNPTLMWAKDPDALDRGGVMKIQMTDRTNDTAGSSASPWIEFPSAMFSQKFGADKFGYYEEQNGEKVFVPYENFTNEYSFCMDIKVPSTYTGRIILEFYHLNTGTKYEVRNAIKQLEKLYPTSEDGESGYKDKWVTLSWTLTELNSCLGTESSSVKNNIGWADVSTNYFSNLRRLRFELSTNKGDMPSAILLDNFRMEKTENLGRDTSGIDAELEAKLGVRA